MNEMQNSVYTQTEELRSSTREREALIDKINGDNFCLRLRIVELENYIRKGITVDELREGKQDRILELMSKVESLETEMTRKIEMLRTAAKGMDLLDETYKKKEAELQKEISELKSNVLLLEEKPYPEQEECWKCVDLEYEMDMRRYAEKENKEMSDTIEAQDLRILQLETERNAMRNEACILEEKTTEMARQLCQMKRKQVSLSVGKCRKRRQAEMRNSKRLTELEQMLKSKRLCPVPSKTSSYTTIKGNEDTISEIMNQTDEEFVAQIFADSKTINHQMNNNEQQSVLALQLQSEYEEACTIIQQHASRIQELTVENENMKAKLNEEKLMQNNLLKELNEYSTHLPIYDRSELESDEEVLHDIYRHADKCINLPTSWTSTNTHSSGVHDARPYDQRREDLFHDAEEVVRNISGTILNLQRSVHNYKSEMLPLLPENSVFSDMVREKIIHLSNSVDEYRNDTLRLLPCFELGEGLNDKELFSPVTSGQNTSHTDKNSRVPVLVSSTHSHIENVVQHSHFYSRNKTQLEDAMYQKSKYSSRHHAVVSSSGSKHSAPYCAHNVVSNKYRSDQQTTSTNVNKYNSKVRTTPIPAKRTVFETNTDQESNSSRHDIAASPQHSKPIMKDKYYKATQEDLDNEFWWSVLGDTM